MLISSSVAFRVLSAGWTRAQSSGTFRARPAPQSAAPNVRSAFQARLDVFDQGLDAVRPAFRFTAIGFPRGLGDANDLAERDALRSPFNSLSNCSTAVLDSGMMVPLVEWSDISRRELVIDLILLSRFRAVAAIRRSGSTSILGQASSTDTEQRGREKLFLHPTTRSTA